MESKLFIDKLISKIEKGEDISPFLFLWDNKELLSEDIKSIWYELLDRLNIPAVYFRTMENGMANIKISEIKNFLSDLCLSSPYGLQIFFIENIWNMISIYLKIKIQI